MIRMPVEDFPFGRREDEDLTKCWNWLRSFITEKEWQKRKDKIEREISVVFRDAPSFSIPLTQGTKLAITEGQFSWYIYLLYTYLEEPYKYEYFQGARVVPIFKQLGANLDLLLTINDVLKKVKDLFWKKNADADAILFEILTALAWARNGWQVSFIAESAVKTPDLLAKKGVEEWQIECKRQKKTADYTYKETVKRQKMMYHVNKMLTERNILLEVVFHVEMVLLPDTFLFDAIKEIVPVVDKPGKIVSNTQVDIDLTFIDIEAIKKHLEQYHVKYPSPQMNALIAQKRVDNKAFTSGAIGKFFRVGEGEANNLWIYDIAKAYGVLCNCDAQEALKAKARDIKSQVHAALQQFSGDTKAVIHVGIETYDGPEVEHERFKKIEGTLGNIDPKNTKLRWVYTHFFQSYSLADQDWAFDETVDTATAFFDPVSPIQTKFLIVPEDSDTADISHWKRILPGEKTEFK